MKVAVRAGGKVGVGTGVHSVHGVGVGVGVGVGAGAGVGVQAAHGVGVGVGEPVPPGQSFSGEPNSVQKLHCTSALPGAAITIRSDSAGSTQADGQTTATSFERTV